MSKQNAQPKMCSLFPCASHTFFLWFYGDCGFASFFYINSIIAPSVIYAMRVSHRSDPSSKCSKILLEHTLPTHASRHHVAIIDTHEKKNKDESCKMWIEGTTIFRNRNDVGKKLARFWMHWQQTRRFRSKWTYCYRVLRTRHPSPDIAKAQKILIGSHGNKNENIHISLSWTLISSSRNLLYNVSVATLCGLNALAGSQK